MSTPKPSLCAFRTRHRGSACAPRPHPIPRPGTGQTLGLWRRCGLSPRPRVVLAGSLRLASARSEAQRFPPVHRAAARNRPALSACAGAGTASAALATDARLAWIRVPVRGHHPAPDRPCPFRWRCGGCGHVIAPSLPGYGLSFQPGQKRSGIAEIADCFADLMTQVLGYQKFAAQGGDWGAFTCSALGVRHPEKLVGIHLNMLSVNPSLRRLLSQRRRRTLCRAGSALVQRGNRLHPDPGDASPNPCLRFDRFTGWACRLDCRKIPHLDRPYGRF